MATAYLEFPLGFELESGMEVNDWNILRIQRMRKAWDLQAATLLLMSVCVRSLFLRYHRASHLSLLLLLHGRPELPSFRLALRDLSNAASSGGVRTDGSSKSGGDSQGLGFRNHDLVTDILFELSKEYVERLSEIARNWDTKAGRDALPASPVKETIKQKSKNSRQSTMRGHADEAENSGIINT